MMTKTIVYILMMLLLAIAALPICIGQISVAPISESNATTATIAKEDSAYIEPEEELFHTMEILGPWRVEW